MAAEKRFLAPGRSFPAAPSPFAVRLSEFASNVRGAAQSLADRLAPGGHAVRQQVHPTDQTPHPGAHHQPVSAAWPGPACLCNHPLGSKTLIGPRDLSRPRAPGSPTPAMWLQGARPFPHPAALGPEARRRGCRREDRQRQMHSLALVSSLCLVPLAAGPASLVSGLPLRGVVGLILASKPLQSNWGGVESIFYLLYVG